MCIRDSGKSLTSKAILGINDKKCVTTGRIDFNVDGEWINLLELNPRGAKIRGIRGKMASMVFQEPMSSFSPLFKIGSQIAEPIRLHITKDKKKAKELAINAMREVGISNPCLLYTSLSLYFPWIRRHGSPQFSPGNFINVSIL